MQGAEFVATHHAPDEGLETWSVPDAARAPDDRLEPGLPVQVLEETTGWARVRCSNDWEAWVDAGRLVALPAPEFAATHRVPASGLDAREEPDPALPVVARIDGGLGVIVVHTRGLWAKVRCSNDWEAWVDGRALLGGGPTEPPAMAATQPVPTAGFAPAPGPVPSIPAAPPGAAVPLSVWLPGAGAALVVLGSFLDWIGRASAWDLGVIGLVTHHPADLVGGVKSGLLLLLTALVALPLLTHRPLPRVWVLALAALAIVVVLGAFLLYLDLDSSLRPDLGIGLFMTLAGGGVIALGALLPPDDATGAAPR